MIGDEFHPAAIAERAEIGALPGEIGKQRRAPGDGDAVAAGIDDEIALFGLRAGAAQRTVERDVAGFRQDVFEAKFVGDGKGAQFDHDARRRTGMGNGEGNILDGGGIGQTGHDDRRIARDAFGIRSNRNIGLRHLGASCSVEVVTNHLPSAFDQIAGDRAAHDAEPDNSNRLVPLLSSCWLASGECRPRLE